MTWIYHRRAAAGSNAKCVTDLMHFIKYINKRRKGLEISLRIRL